MAQNFGEELAALRGIFPSWDNAVLEDLLETHRGNVESCVDSLLAMEATDGAAEAQCLQRPRSPVSGVGSPSRQSNPMANSSYSSKRRPCVRVVLSDDFLRLPSDELRELSGQEERDAILARMLQDQFFRDDVLSSEDASSQFDGNRFSRQSQRHVVDRTAAEIASKTYSAMSEKFTSMSEVMQSKMHEVYMRFQMRNDAPASKDPKSQRPLMESDSESSEDENLRQPDVEVRQSQLSPRRSSPRNLTRRSNVNAGTDSKKYN